MIQQTKKDMKAIKYIPTGYPDVPFRKASAIELGAKFTIVHCDGFVANETVCKIDSDKAQRFYFVCDSGCVYTETEIEKDAIEID